LQKGFYTYPTLLLIPCFVLAPTYRPSLGQLSLSPQMIRSCLNVVSYRKAVVTTMIRVCMSFFRSFLRARTRTSLRQQITTTSMSFSRRQTTHEWCVWLHLYGLDIDPMTLMLDLVLDVLKMYLRTKSVCRSKHSKVLELKQDSRTLTDATECIRGW